MSFSIVNGAPFLSGIIKAQDFIDVINHYNNNYPDFNFFYGMPIGPGVKVRAQHVNDFFTALGKCNTGWKGWTACPDKTFYNVGDRITDIQFKVPTSNFDEIYGKEYFSSGNGGTANQFIVPPGCRYMHLQWAIGGGGGGGGGSGHHPTTGKASRGGGSAAWAKDSWIEVEAGDIITFTVGVGGAGGGGGGAYADWGSPGTATKIVVYRPSLATSFTIFNLDGGGPGHPNDSWPAYNQFSWGGAVYAALSDNYSSGTHARDDDGQAWMNSSWGANSPLGQGGVDQGWGSGYGAGGGGGAYYDD